MLNCTAQDRGAYLSSLLTALDPATPPVLVTPSMSGSFAVPLLVGPARPALAAWVPVAPVATKQVRLGNTPNTTFTLVASYTECAYAYKCNLLNLTIEITQLGILDFSLKLTTVYFIIIWNHLVSLGNM